MNRFSKIMFKRLKLAVLPGAVWLAIACSRSTGPSVVLVSFDTTRADRLGCYGYAQAATPHLDRLAARGVLFERAYTPVPITLPAHASLLTGAYPPAHGVRNNGMFSLADKAVTLAECFRGAGYSTAAFVGSFVLDSRYGLDQGFETYDDDMDSGQGGNSTTVMRERKAGAVTDRAIRWLRGHARGPFFIWVHYFDPHRPFEAPEEFAGRFDDPYDAEISYTDSQLGRILEILDSLGLKDRTLIALCADHGEGLEEHGEKTHGIFLYNSTVRVPLIISIPGREGLAGRRDRREVSLVDVAATLAAGCGIKPPSGSQGISLLPDKGPGLNDWMRPVYLESYYPFYAHAWSPLEGVVRGGRKYVSAPEDEMYDLESDPRELGNLSHEERAAADSMRTVLETLKRIITPREAPAPDRRALMEGREMESLRALGYVAGARGQPPQDFNSLPDPKNMISAFDKYLLGVSYMTDGRLDLAAREFGVLLKSDSANTAAWEYLAETELLRNLPKQAELAAQAACRFRVSERALFLLGMACLLQADSSRAEELFGRSIQLDAGYGPALAMKARLLEARGRAGEALEAYRAAEAAMPGNSDLLNDLGLFLMTQGDLEQAVETLGRAVRLGGGLWAAHFNLGVALQRLGRSPQALEAFREASVLNGTDSRIFNNLGICFFSLGSYDSSRAAYERALELDKLYPEAWNNLGGTLAAVGHLQEAASAYGRALELSPGYLDACVNLGLLLANRLERPDSAIILLRRALSLAPADDPRRTAIEKLVAGLAGK